MTVAELSASVPSGEYELVRGRGKNEDIQFDFSNPLYAEPEREVVSAIYESVSSVRFPGFCNISQITGSYIQKKIVSENYLVATQLKFSTTWEKVNGGKVYQCLCTKLISFQFT